MRAKRITVPNGSRSSENANTITMTHHAIILEIRLLRKSLSLGFGRIIHRAMATSEARDRKATTPPTRYWICGCA